MVRSRTQASDFAGLGANAFPYATATTMFLMGPLCSNQQRQFDAVLVQPSLYLEVLLPWLAITGLISHPSCKTYPPLHSKGSNHIGLVRVKQPNLRDLRTCLDLSVMEPAMTFKDNWPSLLNPLLSTIDLSALRLCLSSSPQKLQRARRPLHPSIPLPS